jgi:DHA2 family multidrug resistance protein
MSVATTETASIPLPSRGQRWVIGVSVLFGALVSVMDVSIVNVAMPHMMGSFGCNLSEVTWVATSYSIAEITLATMAGWWSTVIGRKRLYVASFVIFTIGSVLAGTATSLTQMVVWRTLQGIGGGALIPVSLAIMRETFTAEEQGQAMSLYGMGVVLAPAVGPVLGGWLTDRFGWPWIFYVNVPLALAGIVMVLAYLEDPPYLRRGVQRIDWGGIVLLALGLTVMQVVLERGQQADWFASRWIVAGTVVAMASLALLVVWELHREEPVVNLRLLTNGPLAAGCSIGLVFGVALYGSTFLLPALLQTLLGYDAFQAGLTLMPRALTLFCMMPLAGWAYGRVDVRLLVGIGILVLASSFWDLSHLSANVAFGNLVPMLVLMGMGMSFQFVSLTAASIRTVPREYMTDASSLYTLSRRVGGNVGYAVLATMVARRAQFHHARLVAAFRPDVPAFATAQQHLASLFATRGLDPAEAARAATAYLAGLLDRETALMGYNDAAWLVGIVLLAALPLLFLLPSSKADT